MTDTDPRPVKSCPVVAFDTCTKHEERMAAVLITKADDGSLRAYVKDVQGRNQPDPEIVAALVQSVELRNL